jgi:hypothetical protein
MRAWLFQGKKLPFTRADVRVKYHTTELKQFPYFLFFLFLGIGAGFFLLFYIPAPVGRLIS